MTDPLTDTPTSPPAQPVVPVGLGTQVGLAAAAAQFAACVLTVFLDGDHSQETILTLVTATVTLVTVLVGRFAQAYAMLRDARQAAAPTVVVNAPVIPAPADPNPEPSDPDLTDEGDPLGTDTDLVPDTREVDAPPEPDLGNAVAERKGDQ